MQSRGQGGRAAPLGPPELASMAVTRAMPAARSMTISTTGVPAFRIWRKTGRFRSKLDAAGRDGRLDAVRDWRTARASMAVAPPPPVWSHAGVPPRALICEIITNQRAGWNMSCVRNPLRANRYQLYYRQCPDQTDPVKSDRVQVSHARPKVLGNVARSSTPMRSNLRSAASRHLVACLCSSWGGHTLPSQSYLCNWALSLPAAAARGACSGRRQGQG